jgi:hypothetical protein
MNIKEYAAKINEMAELYPNAEVIYSADEEGNRFGKVFFTPSVGRYDEIEEEFIPYDAKHKFLDKIKENKFDVNAVCIN